MTIKPIKDQFGNIEAHKVTCDDCSLNVIYPDRTIHGTIELKNADGWKVRYVDAGDKHQPKKKKALDRCPHCVTQFAPPAAQRIQPYWVH